MTLCMQLIKKSFSSYLSYRTGFRIDWRSNRTSRNVRHWMYYMKNAGETKCTKATSALWNIHEKWEGKPGWITRKAKGVLRGQGHESPVDKISRWIWLVSSKGKLKTTATTKGKTRWQMKWKRWKLKSKFQITNFFVVRAEESGLKPSFKSSAWSGQIFIYV